MMNKFSINTDSNNFIKYPEIFRSNHSKLSNKSITSFEKIVAVKSFVESTLPNSKEFTTVNYGSQPENFTSEPYAISTLPKLVDQKEFEFEVENEIENIEVAGIATVNTGREFSFIEGESYCNRLNTNYLENKNNQSVSFFDCEEDGEIQEMYTYNINPTIHNNKDENEIINTELDIEEELICQKVNKMNTKDFFCKK